MSKSVSDSERYYEQVKKYFWRPEEADFVVRFHGDDMSEWLVMLTLSLDEMREIRSRLIEEDSSFAGFVRYLGRYCFYFRDENIFKVQYLDNGEINHFNVRSFSEIDLAKVVAEFRMLQGS
jgi:hypothetical protein